jgi:AcrR family transcriptional regulator
VETPLVKGRRADARRNRARLLAAAEDVFAAAGPDASTERIAAAAGVGIGTLFRHFPTKESLLEAVFVERLNRLIDEAAELAGAADAGSAFFTFFRSVLEQAHSKGAIADALEHAGVDLKHSMAEVKARLNERMERLLVQAQRAARFARTSASPKCWRYWSAPRARWSNLATTPSVRRARFR